MSEMISIVKVPRRATVVIAAATTWRELSRVWKSLLDQVHAGVRWEGSGRKGRNVMLYLDDLPHVEVGVELDQHATFDLPIICSMLPAGRAATAVHRGTYDLLGESHARLASWVGEQGLELAGPAGRSMGTGTRTRNCSRQKLPTSFCEVFETGARAQALGEPYRAIPRAERCLRRALPESARLGGEGSWMAPGIWQYDSAWSCPDLPQMRFDLAGAASP